MASDETIRHLLSDSWTVAVVGCSRDPTKASHAVPKYLQEHGYRIIPVNPAADEILGEKSYKSLSDIRERVDIVDVFRPSADVAEIVKEAIPLKPKAIWLQQGIDDPAAHRQAEEQGILVVPNSCIKIEHQRLLHKRR